MMVKEFPLTDDGRARLVAYLHEPAGEMSYLNTRPAVVVCPGGGYVYCSRREADPIAMQYLAAGFHAFVLYYSAGEDVSFPTPLCELSQSMKLIRDNSEEWGIIPDKIAVCGFSAGGHLSASLGTLWNHPIIEKKTGMKNGENRPNALILGYPVTTTSWMVNDGAIERILREDNSLKELLCCQNFVGKHTPPAFLFHTYMDNLVPVEDSLCFANAMAKQDIPFEMHIFKDGGHGLSLASPLTGHFGDGVDGLESSEWVKMSTRWLWRLFEMPGIPKRDFGRRAYPLEENR